MFKCGLYFELFIQSKDFFVGLRFVRFERKKVKRKMYYYLSDLTLTGPPSLTNPSPLQGAAGKDATQEGRTLYIILTSPD